MKRKQKNKNKIKFIAHNSNRVLTILDGGKRKEAWLCHTNF